MNNDTLIGKFELFLLTHARYSTNTCIAYSRDINQFSKFLDSKNIEIKAVHTMTIREYIEYLYNKGLAAASRARKVEALRKFIDFMIQHCGLPFDPNMISRVAKIKLETKLPATLSEKEIKILLKTADKSTGIYALRNRVLVYLLYGSGVRINELLHLKIADVSFSPPLIRVMGKGKERLIPYPVFCVSMIKEYIATLKSSYLFESEIRDNKKNYQPLSRQHASYILNQLAKHAKINRRIYPHLFRHTYANHMLLNGANIRQIQTILGHSRITTTQIYTYLDMNKLRKDYDKKHLRA